MRKKDDEKQNAIKKAVVKIVLEDGMHGTSISKIAKAAGVSPATVYVYYENKDIMLKAIYLEYAQDMFTYLLDQLSEELSAQAFVDVVLRSYVSYMQLHRENYHFVEQFSSCPSLSEGCQVIQGIAAFNSYIDLYIENGSFNKYDLNNIVAMLFYPVKGIVYKQCSSSMNSSQRLDEMIEMIQKALINPDT